MAHQLVDQMVDQLAVPTGKWVRQMAARKAVLKVALKVALSAGQKEHLRALASVVQMAPSSVAQKAAHLVD